VDVGSKKGEEILKDVPHREATDADEAAAEKAIAHATAHMGKQVKMDGVRETLYAATEHPRWEQVAGRCLTCANCTFVCPTCFCVNVEDTTDLQGKTATRSRRWDSCFTVDFSYIHGGSIRPSVKSRYRQWLTHKFASWQDQFGQPGCTGCGRCITWCPVGIDVTEEIAVLQGTPPNPETAHGNH
jgi:sulfhydrogenase subunit beta (sulfur reductase)